MTDERSGFDIGTGVGAGAGDAVDTSGAAVEATTNAAELKSVSSQCFIVRPLFFARLGSELVREALRRYQPGCLLGSPHAIAARAVAS
jgi:hypothetical protein